MLTPYQFASNTPIQAIDLDGLEAWYTYDIAAGAYVQVRPELSPGPIPVEEANKKGFYTSAQVHKKLESQAFRQEVAKREQFRNANRQLAQHKAKTSNIYWNLHQVVGTADATSIINDVGGGNYGRAAITAGLVLLPEALEQISYAFRQSARRGLGAVNSEAISGSSRDFLRPINSKGGEYNCVGCAIAVDNTVKGRGASALGDDFANKDIGLNDITDMYGKARSFSKFWQVSDYLRGVENGTAIVATRPGAGAEIDGHVFNLVNDNGSVRIFDGQLGQEILPDQLKGYLNQLSPKSFSVWDTTGQ